MGARGLLRDIRSRLTSVLPASVRQNLVVKVVLVLVVVIVLIGLVGGVFYSSIDDELDRQIDQQVRSTTALHASVYADWFDNRRSRLSEVVRIGTLARGDTGEISTLLAEESIRSDEIRNYHYVSTETGEILASSNPEAIGTSVLTNGFDRDILQQHTFVLSSQYRSQDGTATIALGRASPFSNVNRVLIAEIAVGEAGPAIQQTIPDSSTSVLSRSGETLIGPGVDADVPELDGVTVTRNESHILAFHRLEPDSDLVVVTQSPKTSAFAVRDAVLRSFLTTLLLTFIILVGVSLAGGRSVVTDLLHLVDRARRIGDGELDVNLETAREDEIGELYAEFDSMRDQLKSRIRTAEQSREQTEHLNEQLQVLDRLLRHNLKNDLNTILLNAEMIQEGCEDPYDGYATEIVEKGNQLLTKAEKQREITQVLSPQTERKPRDIVPGIERVIQELSEAYPGVTLALDAPPSVSAPVTNQFQEAVFELVENAIVHNDREDPRITVTISSNADTTTVRVEDNGPGIPVAEQQILTGTQPIDPLNHGSGVGLWLVFWVVRRSNGRVDVTENTPHGSVITLELPAEPGG
jgi:signal transduction histidine kinase